MVVILVLLLDSAAAISYLQGNGLAAKLDGELEFYHSDSLGSTRAITDELGFVIEEQKSLPFGGVLEGDEKYGFTGKELDESGLQYFGSRYYDSSTGRFISTDPAMQYHSPYIYAANNPLAYRDSDGRFAQFAPAIPFLATPAGWVAVSGLALFTAGFMAYQAVNGPLITTETFPAIEFPSSWNEIFPAQTPIDNGILTSPAEAPIGTWTETFPAAADALFWQEQFIPPVMEDMSVMLAKGGDIDIKQLVGEVRDANPGMCLEHSALLIKRLREAGEEAVLMGIDDISDDGREDHYYVHTQKWGAIDPFREGLTKGRVEDVGELIGVKGEGYMLPEWLYERALKGMRATGAIPLFDKK